MQAESEVNLSTTLTREEKINLHFKEESRKTREAHNKASRRVNAVEDYLLHEDDYTTAAKIRMKKEIAHPSCAVCRNLL